MAFAMLVLKANKINNQRVRLKAEKEHGLKMQEGLTPKYTIMDRYSHRMVNWKLKMSNYFRSIFSFPKHSWMHKISFLIRQEGTVENYLFKSAVGFIGGIFLIYIFFMFFIIILKYNFGAATLICSIFGSILTVGLAFSQNVRYVMSITIKIRLKINHIYCCRCVVFLILPEFFSKRGRQALLAYAFVLAVSGPAKNTLNNLGILSESLACGQVPFLSFF